MIDDPREAYVMRVYEEYPTEYDDDEEGDDEENGNLDN